MKRTFAAIGIAFSLMLATVSCSKDLNTGVDRSSSTTSLTVSASLPDYDEGTKGGLIANIRVKWLEGETVYVYDNAKCLGTLTAALEDGNDRYAVLSGTITSSSAAKLTLVATSDGLAPSASTQDAPLSSGIDFDLSTQSMDEDQAPYVVYATIDNPTGTGVSNVKTSFTFATSIINVNCTALKEGTAVDNVKIEGVKTSFSLVPSADGEPTLTVADATGTITRNGASGGALGSASKEGVFVFSVAVLEQDATLDRKIKTSQSGWPGSASFSAAALTKGTSYNTVCQLSGPYKTIGGHSGVRLWADGPYWATCNIGAESPSENGYYYMWGSTQAYEYRELEGTDNDGFYKAGTNTKIDAGGFAWTNYTEFGAYNSSNTETYGFNKYTANKTGGDGKSQLEPIDDAATIEWGSPWRMPTADGEFQKLKDNCDWNWKATAPQGYLVTGKGEYAGISVFFPAAGCVDGTSLLDAGSYGGYWSSTLNSDDTNYAYGLFFSSSYVVPRDGNCRYFGYSVRPVSD